MCEYCYKRDDGEIIGRTIRTNDLKKTAGYEPSKNKNDFLEMFILKLKNDKKAGLMIDNGYGYRYIDINYCPMCRKEAGRVKRHASGYWYQFIIPRRLTLPPTRIYRWLNFYWRLKDKEE